MNRRRFLPKKYYQKLKNQQVGVLKVAAVVTDIAPTMVNAWKILEQKYPSVFANGCGAHMVNLLVKDICKLPEYENPLAAARGFIMNRVVLRKRFGTIQKRLVQDREMDSARALATISFGLN
jgi:hypothetical protein